MCCLFGFVDYKGSMSKAEKDRMLRILSIECEARGTDATGIAYMQGNRMRILKKPKAAHQIRFSVPNDVNVVMGHTRLTTQGAAAKNYNNHPFPGKAGNKQFAFAHNGVLYNEESIRKLYDLPETQIETDSYVVAQALEAKGVVDFSSLADISEHVSGSFCFTALTQENTLFIVKGDNPMCLYHFPKKGIYMYASTEAILQAALKRLGMMSASHEEIRLIDGQIIKIQEDGSTEFAEFEMPEDLTYSYWRRYGYYDMYNYNYDGYDDDIGLQDLSAKDDDHKAYFNQLVEFARYLGYDEEDVLGLLHIGYSLEDVEDYLYETMYPRRYFSSASTSTDPLPVTM